MRVAVATNLVFTVTGFLLGAFVSPVAVRTRDSVTATATERTAITSSQPASPATEPEGTAEDSLAGVPDAFEVHSMVDVQQAIAAAGANPSAEKLWQLRATLHDWAFSPDAEGEAYRIRLQVDADLRRAVVAEVTAHHAVALKAESSRDGAEHQAEAARIIALYPLSSEPAVLEQAKQLAYQQAELAARLEVLRRQRYNRWATDQIDKAIKGYYDNSSYRHPKEENPKLVRSLVDNLSAIDPVLLEPAVLELYNYAITLTKESISEQDKVQLARELTDTGTKRRLLGDL